MKLIYTMIFLLGFIVVTTDSKASNLSLCLKSDIYLWDNCFGSHTYDNGAKYIGEFSNGNPHGRGALIHAGEWVGHKYVGEFRDGQYNGQGTYSYGNGDLLAGTFKNDRPDGLGAFAHSNGAKYLGEFIGWSRNGHGTYTFANGEIYTGKFKNDEPNGWVNKYFRMVTYTRVNLKGGSEMAWEPLPFLMVESCRVSGKMMNFNMQVKSRCPTNAKVSMNSYNK